MGGLNRREIDLIGKWFFQLFLIISAAAWEDVRKQYCFSFSLWYLAKHALIINGKFSGNHDIVSKISQLCWIYGFTELSVSLHKNMHKLSRLLNDNFYVERFWLNCWKSSFHSLYSIVCFYLICLNAGWIKRNEWYCNFLIAKILLTSLTGKNVVEQ